jgi:WD40 repeat protein/transcriptional regulator with XRE-family HTH domain
VREEPSGDARQASDTSGETFGERLRRLRTDRGLSLADLARRVHYSRGHLSKVETGQKAPSVDLARGCDEALEADGTLVALVPPVRRSDTVCPYPGLASFGREDAQWFFGRRRATAALVERAAEHLRDGGRGGPIIVVGPSGAGKSSLLYAGLLPALARGALPVPGSETWPTLCLTPTADPVGELVQGLSRVTGLDARTVRRAAEAGPDALASLIRGKTYRPSRQGHGRRRPAGPSGLVLVVDQFEEVFTLCTSDNERHDFVRALHALSRPVPYARNRILVILGVRADFYGQCLSHPELVAALRDGQFPLGPMTRDELREAITGPARTAGLELEPGLTEVLLNDLGARGGTAPGPSAGNLPLLAHALLTTWQQREKGRLTVAGYQSTGGIGGAVAASAERVYAGLEPEAQAIARSLLLGLVRVGEADQDTRRRVRHGRLMSLLPDPDAAGQVLRAFTDARLLTTAADHVEITHEALLYAWPRLRGWIDADRAGLRNRQRLAEDAERWEASGHDTALLYRGTQLAVSVDWINGRLIPADAPERRFLDAGVRHERHETAARVRRTRRLRQLVALLSALVLLTVGTTGFALWQRADALAERDRSAAQVAVDEAERLRQVDPSLAARLSLAAYRVAAIPRTRGALLASSGSVHSTPLPRHRYTVRKAVRHGSLLATAAEDGLVRLTDIHHPARPAEIATLTGRDALTGVAITPDGRLLATGGAEAAVTLWELSHDRPRHLATLPAGDAVTALAFGHDGGTLVAVTESAGMRIWAIGPNDPPARLLAVRETGHKGPINDVAFSPDGRTLATASDDHTVRLWNVTQGASPTSLARLTHHRAQVRGVAFAPDGRTLASVGFDQTVHLTPIANPRRPGKPEIMRGHNGLIHSVAFRPDGRQLVTGGDDQTARLWDVADRRQLMALPQPNPVRAVTFGPGNVLVTGDDEGRVLLWHLPPPVTLTPDQAISVAYARGGRLLVSANAKAGARIWDVSAAGHVTPLADLRHPALVYAVAVSPDGRLVATAGEDRRVRLWDVSDVRHPVLLSSPIGHEDEIYTVAMSRDKRLLITGGEDHTARLWDIGRPAHPELLTSLRDHTDRINEVSLSGDGRLLATAGGDYRARIWDVSDRRRPVLLAVLLHPNQVNGVELAPNGRFLATTDDDRKVRLWAVPKTAPMSPVPDSTAPVSVMIGHREASRGAAFAPDGRTLATTSDDRTVQMWDVANPEQPVLLTTLTGHTGPVYDARFSPDGRFVTTAGRDAALRFWSNDVAAVIRRVCALDGPLNREEWRNHFPQQPFRESCEDVDAADNEQG